MITFFRALLWKQSPLIAWPAVGRGTLHHSPRSHFEGGAADGIGPEQMRAWADNAPSPKPRLKTGLLYCWLRHPMYVGVLLAIWATPQLTVGRLLLATCMTVYVLIALRYEERDLTARFGSSYARWRTQ